MNKTLALLTLTGMVASGVAVAQSTTQAAMTEAQARYAMGSFGCNNVSALGQGPEGSWHGQCSKGGQTVNVMMDRQGKVSTGSAPTHITEGNARSMMTEAGCSNISTLKMGSDGSWRGQCSKGGRTANVAVNGQGQIKAE